MAQIDNSNKQVSIISSRTYIASTAFTSDKSDVAIST